MTASERKAVKAEIGLDFGVTASKHPVPPMNTRSLQQCSSDTLNGGATRSQGFAIDSGAGPLDPQVQQLFDLDFVAGTCSDLLLR
jgi:hypothetical protein